MAFIIVNSTNENIVRILRYWENGSRRKSAQKYFIRKIGAGTYIMKANAAVLTLLYDLKMKYDGGIYIFVANSLEVDIEYPEEVIKVVKECRKKGKNIPKRELELLEKIKIKSSMSWKQEL